MLRLDMPLPPAAPLRVTDRDRKRLVALSRQRSIPRGILLRGNIVLGAAGGQAHHFPARDLSTTVTTVWLWRKRYPKEAAILEATQQSRVRHAAFRFRKHRQDTMCPRLRQARSRPPHPGRPARQRTRPTAATASPESTISAPFPQNHPKG